MTKVRTYTGSTTFACGHKHFSNDNQQTVLMELCPFCIKVDGILRQKGTILSPESLKDVVDAVLEMTYQQA
jgi:hypothetical protein